MLDARYRLADRLGEGGMGVVYRATHTLMDRPCAIKVLRGPSGLGAQAGKRFQREAQSASRLDHDHCIRVSDFGVTDDDLMFLVMELLEGRSLAEVLADEGALPLPRALHIARQVADALAHAHGLGVVHRDLKPDNIFLVTRGADHDFVKVLDFGLAKLIDGTRDGRLNTLSEAGTVFGTPEYMAPEQAEARPLDGRADLYSFGIVLYQMLTGQLPFQGATLVAIITQHLHETPVSPAVRRPDLNLPPPLVALCMKCLAKSPDDRPPSARAVVAALASLDLTPAPPRVPRSVASHPTVEIELDTEALAPARRSRTPFYLALVAAAGVGFAVFAMRPAPQEAPAPPDAPPPAAAVAVAAPAADAAPAPVVAADPVPRPRAAPTAADHLREAERFGRQGNRIKELFHLQQAARIEPGNADALYRLGAALLQDGQRGLGCQKLERAGKIAETLYVSSGCPPREAH